MIIFLLLEMHPVAIPSVASSVCQPGLTVVLYVPCLLHTMLSLSQGLKDSEGDGSCCKYCERDVGGKWLDYSKRVTGRYGNVCLFAKPLYLGLWVYGLSGVVLFWFMIATTVTGVYLCMCVSTLEVKTSEVYVWMRVCIISVLSKFVYFIYVW